MASENGHMHGEGDTGAAAPDDTDPLRLSLVIPAFNEALRLEAGFARLMHAIETGGISAQTTEFILVDDGSTDGTAACARSLFSALPHANILRLDTNAGKGAAVRAGVAAATGPRVIFADADMAIDPTQTPQFVEALESADLAIGSRADSGASVDRPSLSRSVMNKTFNGLVNVVTRVSLNDTQCGFKAFRAPSAKLLFHCTVTERMAFDVEMLLLARRLGLKINQVPVQWLRVKGSHVSPLKDTFSMVYDVLRVRRTVQQIPTLHALRITLPAANDGMARHSADLLAHLRRLSRLLPVIRRDDGYLVLLPLTDDAGIATHSRALSGQLDGMTPAHTTVSIKQLWTLAPLMLSWDDDAVTSTAT
jgi:dolichyl-phosphate beta-glucosyltransferase